MTGWAHQAGRRNLGACSKMVAGIFHKTNVSKQLLCIWSVIQIVLYWGTLLWSGELFPATSDIAEEFCFNFQGPFRIVTVLPHKGAARNVPENLSHLPTSLKLFLYALLIEGLSWSLPYPTMEKEEIKRVFSWKLHFGMWQYLKTI